MDTKSNIYCLQYGHHYLCSAPGSARICIHVRIQRGTGTPDPLEKYKNVEFLSNIGPDPLNITKLPCQHSIWAIIQIVFGLLADDCPFILVFGPSLPSSTKNKPTKRLGTLLTTLSGSARGIKQADPVFQSKIYLLNAAT